MATAGEDRPPLSRDDVRQIVADLRAEHTPEAMRAAMRQMVDDARQHMTDIQWRATVTHHWSEYHPGYARDWEVRERGDVDAQ
jgi:hypothetical protein